MTDETEALHHPHGPSWMNGGSLCIHFKSKPGGPAAERGTGIHESIARVLRDNGAWVPAGNAEDDAAIQFALDTAKKHLRHIDGVERLLYLEEESPC